MEDFSFPNDRSGFNAEVYSLGPYVFSIPYEAYFLDQSLLSTTGK